MQIFANFFFQIMSFYFLLPLIYFIAVLPFPLLYGFSNVMKFFLFHVSGYRKKVVFTSLKNSFPEKSEKEIHELASRFYTHLCDVILESFKAILMSRKQILRRFKWNDESQAVMKKLFEQNKNIIMVGGHMGNFEWANLAISTLAHHQIIGVYKPIRNQNFDKFMKNLRQRYGTIMISGKESYKFIYAYNQPKPFLLGLVSDQTPAPENAYWTTFLNQDTPVFWGAENMSRELNCPLVFVSVKKVKRGFYETSIEILFENPKETKTGEITEAFTRRLEKDIREQPEIWLWSHRRWKHGKRKVQIISE